MLCKSHALVIRKTPYSDNSGIYSIFTRSHGILSFIIQGIHGKSGKAALFQPGNLLELVFYYQPNKNLQRIKEARLLEGFPGYGEHPVRLQAMVFALELIQKSLPEEHEDPAAFSFIESQLSELAQSSQLGWFPLKFLMGLTEVCGLGLQLEGYADNQYLLLEHNENINYRSKPQPMQYLEENEILACSRLLKGEIPEINMEAKRRLTEKLLQYLQVHLFPEKELRSFPILMEILH